MIVFAIVLFQKRWADSPTIRTLSACLKDVPDLDFRVLLLDNSGPGFESPLALAQTGRLDIKVFETNAGLAFAYNFALAYCLDLGAHCLVTLDQDSQVTPAYLRALIAGQDRLSGRTVALAPTVVSAGRVVSPFRLNMFGLPRYGVRQGELCAINSFSAYSVAYLANHGGFDDYYWLDGLDFSVYARIHRQGFRAELLDTVVDHELSLVSGSVSQGRMVNLMRFEATFLFEYCRVLQIAGGLSRLFARALRPRRYGLSYRTVAPVLRAVFAGAGMGWKRRAIPKAEKGAGQ